ncbi:MAG: TonB-dependent receptor [Bacteroidales bacterium]|nr:TonB-dependent receptor [Bacteroidales bacterium]
MYKKERSRSVLRFRRFCRGGWAAFNSMHREVTIGRVANYIADLQLRKSAAVAACCFVAAVGSPVQAQSDDGREARTLPEVEVALMDQPAALSVAAPAAVLTSEDISGATVRTLSDLLAMLPGVDLRIRGVGDAQGDLSMRGGTFDQMLLLLNGINLTDAQTGHHTLDIPIDLSMVERVELLSPAQCLARGIVAFCGAVNIVVSDHYRDQLLADISGGSFGTANASLLATKALGRWAVTASAAYHRSDGYRANTDYRHGSFFLQAQRHGDRHDLHLQLGGQLKGFGGAGFYSTAYPDQYEATRTLTASVTDKFRFSGFNVQFSVYGRLHRDRFELFREGYVAEVPDWYTGHNHHLGSLAGVQLRAVRPLPVGVLTAGADLRREGILSNVLGQPDTGGHRFLFIDGTTPSPFDHAAARTTATLFGSYAFSRGAFSAEAVALGAASSRFGADYGLAATAGYRLSMLDFRFAVSRTYRLPTFTDLYYQGPNQRSNPDLAPEASTTAEVSVAGRQLKVGEFGAFDFQVSAYRRAGRDIIDWVRSPEEELWHSMNHTAVDALGLDAAARLRWSRLRLQCSYSLCHIEQDAGGLISGSALDYLRHRLSADAQLSVDVMRFKLGGAYRSRVGQYVDEAGQVCDYGGVFLLSASAEYDLRQLTLYVQGYNLLGTHYRDHGGVPQPGASLLVGMRARW